jgi:hypothetical protein
VIHCLRYNSFLLRPTISSRLLFNDLNSSVPLETVCFSLLKMAESTPKTYEGSCHCRNIRYTVTIPEALAPEGTGKVKRCNCSICTKNGALFNPSSADMLLTLQSHHQATSSSTQSEKMCTSWTAARVG